MNSSSIQGDVTSSTHLNHTTYELEMQVPREIALDLFFVFEQSKKPGSSTFSNALYDGLLYANRKREDTITVCSRFNAKGWNSLLQNIVEPKASKEHERGQNLGRFLEFLEGL